jgi:hypothetical protein
MEQEESQGLGEKMLAQALRAEGLSLPPEDGAGAPIWQQLIAGPATRAATTSSSTSASAARSRRSSRPAWRACSPKAASAPTR